MVATQSDNIGIKAELPFLVQPNSSPTGIRAMLEMALPGIRSPGSSPCVTGLDTCFWSAEKMVSSLRADA